MKLHIKALLILSSVLFVTRACSTGCLRCDLQNKTCLICDFINNYVADGNGGCAESTITNCEQLDGSGGCYLCKKNRYYDPNTKTCIFSRAVDKCENYSGPTTCVVCTKNYYLSENACFEVSNDNRIDNCNIYGSATTCAECNDKFIPSIDKASCVSINKNKCYNYNNYFCNRCDTDKTISLRNAYLLKHFEQNEIEVANSVVTNLFFGVNSTLITSTCVTTAVPNCEVFKSFNKCSTCATGYFVNDTEQCEAYTVGPIEGCLEYISDTACNFCGNGYYLTGNICTKSTFVENCVTYSNVIDACILCSDLNYLSEGTCLPRENVLDECVSYVVDEDKCSKCNNGFQIEDSGTNCVELPSNCKSYSAYNSDTGDITCEVCNDGYYLSENVCTQGTIEHCKTYTVDANTCARCENDYELSSGNCVSHSFTIDNCVLYMTESPTRCETCDYYAHRFFEDTICEAINIVANCIAYADINTCETCELGYELVSPDCVEIPVSEHCLIKSDGNCTRCTDDYELKENVCIAVPNMYTAHCAVADAETLGINYKCIGCEENYVPFSDIQDVCVEASKQSFSLIDKCKKYAVDGDSAVCSLCASTHTLSKDHSQCLGSCPDGQVKYLGKLTLDTINNTATVNNFAQCYDLSDFNELPQGCEVASYNLKDDSDVCLKCAEGYIPIESCKLEVSFFDTENLSSYKDGQSYSAVSCIAQNNDTVLLPSSGTPDPNCKFYYPVGSRYYCRQCVFGKTGVINIDIQDEHYINCSNTVADCDTSVVTGSGYANDSWIADMYGFNVSYEFTCHKCTDANKIPFIHLANNGELKSYQLNDTDNIPSQAATLDGEMTVCRKPTKEGLFVAEENYAGFVDNCALGLIVVDQNKNVSTTVSSARCLACKDGYTAKSDDSGFYIESCEVIDNCASNPDDGWFNGCKTCSEGFTKEYSQDGKLDANNCTAQLNITNCKAYNSYTNVCVACERGYYLDLDNKCTDIGIPYCPDYAQGVTLSYILNDNSLNYSQIYYFGATGFDCYGCDDGYVAVNLGVDRALCAEHPNLETQALVDGSLYIPNCEKYYDDNSELRCHECSCEYIVSEDNTTCYDSSSLTGCSVANNAGTACAECSEGYLLDQEVCYLLNIDNCQSYSVNESTLVCTKCIEGFKKDGDACVDGGIENCGEYAEDGKCSVCKAGFYLLTEACLSIPSYDNCSRVTLDVKNFIFHCTECKADFILKTSDVVSADHPICLNQVEASNCVEYDDSFNCSRCNDDYYLDCEGCAPRTVTVENCKTYANDKDECSECKRGFSLSENTCSRISNNIPFCTRYADELKCVACSENRYLENNECLEVPPESLIANCQYYESLTKCSECKGDYFLQDNICALKVVKNCEVWSTASVCASCPPGYLFFFSTYADSFSRECENLSGDAKFQNCEIVSTYGRVCRRCNEGYYLNSDYICSNDQPVIGGCKYYATSTTCNICQLGYIRSTDGTTCTFEQSIKNLETDCLDLRYRAKPYCSACKPGFYFNSGSCVECSTNKFSDGCMYCNPNDNSVCLICRPKFYMNDDGACIGNNAGIEDVDQDDSDDFEESAGVLGVFGLFLGLFVVLFR